MTSRLNDFLDTRDENDKLQGDARKPDGTPTTAADVVGQPPLGASSADTKYTTVGWSDEIPVAALTSTATKLEQARAPGGFLEVLSITQIRGDTRFGLRAPDATGAIVNFVGRTLV